MNLNLGKENFMADLKFMPELKKVREDACGQSVCVDLNKESEMENVNKVKEEKEALKEFLIEKYMKDDFSDDDAEAAADYDLKNDYDYWVKNYAQETACTAYMNAYETTIKLLAA